MAIHLQTTNTTSSITANVSGDIWVIAEGSYVTTVGTAINGSGTNGSKTFHIDGHVIADNSQAISLGDFSTASGGGNELYISATGTMGSTGTAISSFGGFLTLANLGSISSVGGDGILATDGNNIISSTGEIVAGAQGVEAGGTGNMITVDGSVAAVLEGILAVSGSTTVGVSGQISSRTLDAVKVGTSGVTTTGSNEVVIAASGGLVAEVNGVLALGGSNKVANAGSIATDALNGTALHVRDGSNTVTNAGQISAGGVVSMQPGEATACPIRGRLRRATTALMPYWVAATSSRTAVRSPRARRESTQAAPAIRSPAAATSMPGLRAYSLQAAARPSRSAAGSLPKTSMPFT